jgi:basic amino acid/polyamine antiporter, APA family
VIGSIIGTGVFAMPAVLASAGTSSLVTLAVIGVGAMLLALMFGQLTRRVPKASGGLYAYARHEFGDFAGYVTGWCYWIQAWAGNAAIVAAWVLYVDSLFGISHPSAWTNWGIALLGLWVPVGLNLAGVRNMAWFQNLTVLLKFLPLLFVAVEGCSSSRRRTSARSTPPAAASMRRSGSRPGWPCSRSSAWRSRP